MLYRRQIQIGRSNNPNFKKLKTSRPQVFYVIPCKDASQDLGKIASVWKNLRWRQRAKQEAASERV